VSEQQKSVTTYMDEHKRRRTEITIETVSVTTIRSRKAPQKYYCKVCGDEVEPLPLRSEQRLLNGKNAVIDVVNTAIDADE
jgi:hypothetical protein